MTITREEAIEELATIMKAQGEPTTPEQHIADELHLMKTAGIIEVAVRNPNVAEYMEHWEARAAAAETELTALRATEQRLRKALVSDEGPDLGATSREPSLQSIIFRHYAPHMSENDALRLTDRYLAALTETTPPMGQGEPGERA